jgi:hypothetical protein
MVGGLSVVKPEKILPMCESALTELMGDLKKRIAKIVSKAEKNYSYNFIKLFIS